MNSPASVEGRDEPRLRLFCALLLPAESAELLSAWQRAELAGAPGARIVRPESLHFTLAFLGHRPAGEVEAIARALGDAAAAAGRPTLRVERYRETRSVGMLVFGDEDGRAAALATDLHGRLERLGVYEPERRPWLPHVTVLRFRGRPPGLRPPLPELDAVGPSDIALYHSVLRSGGAQYEVLSSFALGG